MIYFSNSIIEFLQNVDGLIQKIEELHERGELLKNFKLIQRTLFGLSEHLDYIKSGEYDIDKQNGDL